MRPRQSPTRKPQGQKGPPGRALSGAVRWALCCLLVAAIGAGLARPIPARAQGATSAQDPPLVTVEIRYHGLDAGAVSLLWGIDGWAAVPDTTRPAGTELVDGLMHTPMDHGGGAFVAHVRVPTGATIDYCFLIAQRQDPASPPAWEASAGREYHTTATQDGVVEVQPPGNPAQDRPSAEDAASSLVTQAIRYRLPEARKVFLVWGVDGWAAVAEEDRPPNTTLDDDVMVTRMVPDGDTFVATVRVPAGTTIDYAFQITRLRGGRSVEIWDANGESRRSYHTTAADGDGVTVQAHPLVREQIARSAPAVELPWPAVLLAALCVLLGAVALRTRRIQRKTSLLILILAVAAVLRLNRVTQPFIDAFSWRQASTAMMAQNYYRTNWNIFYPEVNWNGPGPTYQGREFQTVTYIAALLYRLLGQRDWVGRGVAVAFGLWGIFALYQLVRRVWDEDRALAGAAVMALLPGSIFIERSFLPDPAMVALVVTSIWMFVAYLQTGRPRHLVLTAVIGAWGLLTKLPGAIAGLPMAYAMLAILRRNRTLTRRRLAAIGVAAAGTLVPVVVYYLWVRHLSLTYPPYHFAGNNHWVWSRPIGELLDRRYFLPGLCWNLSSWMWTKPVVVLVSLGLFLFPLPGQRARRPASRLNAAGGSARAPWLFHWWMAAGVVYYLIGASELVYNSWNFHIINPAAAALAGHAIVSIGSFLPRAIRRPAATVTTAAVLLAVFWSGQMALPALVQPSGPLDATQSYRMGLALRQVSQPGDLVVTVPSDIGEPIAIYYSGRRGWTFPPSWPGVAWASLPQDDDEAIRLFEDLRTQGADWLGIVAEHEDELWQDYPVFAAHVEHTCELVSRPPDFVIFRILSPGELGDLGQVDPPTPAYPADMPLSNQEIRYRAPEAREVFLIWGIDGWTLAPQEARPAGTRLKNGVMHTPMAPDGDTFVARVHVPAGATIDYGFLITKTNDGATTHTWDADGNQDYHLVATHDGFVEVHPMLNMTQSPGLAGAYHAGLPTLVGVSVLSAVGLSMVARRRPALVDLKALFRRQRFAYLRDLLRELVARDMKLRYKRSVLGVVWSLLNPLFQMLVFIFLSRRVLALDIPNYPSFVFIGVLAWNWFQGTVVAATGAITGNRELIRRPGFPVAILPVVTVTTNLIHFLLALPVLLPFLLAGGGRLTSAILVLPFVVVLQFVLILGLGYLVATVHVTFRDTQHLLIVAFMLLFYLTPVFYDASVVPERAQLIYRLNPMFHLITAYRVILIQGGMPDFRALLPLAAIAAGLLWVGHAVFQRASARFVEEL